MIKVKSFKHNGSTHKDVLVHLQQVYYVRHAGGTASASFTVHRNRDDAHPDTAIAQIGITFTPVPDEDLRATAYKEFRAWAEEHRPELKNMEDA